MPDNEKLDLSPQERADILGETDRLRSSVAFMGELAGKGKLNRDEAVVHLSLICQAHDSLAGLLGVDAVSTALSESNRLLQAANARIHELEQKLGSEISVPAAMARLKSCEDWFATWYQLCGMHYISAEWSPYGLKFDTSDQIEHPSDEPESITFGDRTLAVRIAPCIPYAFLNYDLKHDTFHDNLLDTQPNRNNLENLFKRAFPGAKIFSFKSHLDGTDRLLQAEGHIPWEDIEAWHAAMLEASGKLPAPAGTLYVEKADLASRLASKAYTSHADKGALANERARIAWLRAVTGLWEQAMTALGGASQLPHSIEISVPWPKGNELGHKFYAGATKRSIGEWFDESFKIDWKTGLDGKEA